MHIGTFRFKTLAFAVPFPLRRVAAAVSLFMEPFSALTACGSEFFSAETPRRTCQTGLLRPTWTPARPGLLGHFLDLDSPAELLREHGALLTFRIAGAPANNLGRLPEFPADLLREKGHRLIFNSAELAPLPLLLSFFFPFSFPFSLSSVLLLLLLFSAFFFSLFLKMSFHRFDDDNVEDDDDDSVMAGEDSGPEPGSGSRTSGSELGVS